MSLGLRASVCAACLWLALGFATALGEIQPAQSTIVLDPLTDQLDQPVGIAFSPDASGRLFVIERAGQIVVLKDGLLLPTPFLDLSELVRDAWIEQGLLSLAFHPAYTSNGLFYVAYTPGPGQVIVARYRVSAENPDAADPQSGEVLLKVRKGYDGHNGGQLAFGPDGYLYVGIGDGVRPENADAPGNAQSTEVLLGKILRLDVNGSAPYGIPPDNPFVAKPGARPEIWAYGLRNPWRFSFDRTTGELYIGDVGLKDREEIDRQPAGVGGQNYGWNHLEGNLCRDPDGACDPAAFTPPIFDYGRSIGGTVIGGYVYRGVRIPQLAGRYVFGDYKNGSVWALDPPDGPGAWVPNLLLETGLRITSFGEDNAGELYLVDFSEHGLYRLEPAPAS